MFRSCLTDLQGGTATSSRSIENSNSSGRSGTQRRTLFESLSKTNWTAWFTTRNSIVPPHIFSESAAAVAGIIPRSEANPWFDFEDDELQRSKILAKTKYHWLLPTSSNISTLTRLINITNLKPFCYSRLVRLYRPSDITRHLSAQLRSPFL